VRRSQIVFRPMDKRARRQFPGLPGISSRFVANLELNRPIVMIAFEEGWESKHMELSFGMPLDVSVWLRRGEGRPGPEMVVSVGRIPCCRRCLSFCGEGG